MKLKDVYNTYIGWIVLMIIITPLVLLLNTKYIEFISKLKNIYNGTLE